MAFLYAGAAPFVGDRGTTNVGGLYRRDVDGESWEKLDGGLPDDVEVRCIEIDRAEPGALYAGTQYGLYRGTDDGAHWQKLALPDDDVVLWSILQDPADPATLFVGTAPHRIYRSRDRGASWTRLDIVEPRGLIDMGFPCRIIRMTANPDNASELYAGIEVGGVIRSLDGGDSWQDCSGDLLRLADHEHLKSAILSDTDTEGMMDSHALAVSGHSPESVLLATRMGLFRSGDRAMNWAELPIGEFSPLTYARDIVLSPHDPKTLYAALSDTASGRAGSLYRSADFGETWQRLDHGIPLTSTLMKVAVSRDNPDRLACAARKGQVLGSEDGGQSWRDLSLPDGVSDVYSVACA
jgi:photosystem II stability/assembly factor-like uncharacterized protein